jgi:serine/threonine-protein kinase
MIAERYEVGALIGRGGMADVYEGIDTRLGRKIAIKILKADLVADPSFEVKFRQEAQNSARMTHPTIVRVYDTGEEQSVDANGNERRTPYIVMEFVHGTVLRDLMHARKLSIAESIGFAEGILTALEFSHRAGIIHRDIKSANVMITDAGVVKVMDFGIARAMSDSSATQSHTTGIVGTAQYFSPEQARGESVDARTDLYSTGVLLYEMLAGRPPFVGETAVSVAYQHVSELVTKPSDHNPQISAALDDVVMHSLAKDRNDRYQSAEQFREHLLAAALAPEATETVSFIDELIGAPENALHDQTQTTVIDSADTRSFDELLGELLEVPEPESLPTPANTNPFTTLGVEFEPEIVDTSLKVERTDKAKKMAGLAWGVGSGLVVFVVGMLVFVLSFGQFNVNLPSNKNIEVVDVIGQTFEDGAAKLTELGLSVVEKGVTSDTVPADTIISTDPPAGASVPKATEITVTYSTGAAEVSIPSLLGKTEQEAKDALTAVGLVLGTITQSTSPTAALGKVIQSSPETGTYTASGSTVDLIISNGKVEVPDVTSMNVNQASTQLSGAGVGLKVQIGTTEVGCVNVPPQGQTVLSQSIAPGPAKQRSTITLFVACTG